MNIEKTIIKRTIGYLISRDIWLAILVCGHTLVYYSDLPQIKIVIISVLAAGVLLWILFFTRLIKAVSIARKDKYLAAAFSDEYFSNIKVRAGHNGYIGMVICCIVFIFGSILFSELSVEAHIPLFIAGEITLLVGVVTDDISKIMLSRG